MALVISLLLWQLRKANIGQDNWRWWSYLEVVAGLMANSTLPFLLSALYPSIFLFWWSYSFGNRCVLFHCLFYCSITLFLFTLTPRIATWQDRWKINLMNKINKQYKITTAIIACCMECQHRQITLLLEPWILCSVN